MQIVTGLNLKTQWQLGRRYVPMPFTLPSLLAATLNKQYSSSVLISYKIWLLPIYNYILFQNVFHMYCVGACMLWHLRGAHRTTFRSLFSYHVGSRTSTQVVRLSGKWATLYPLGHCAAPTVTITSGLNLLLSFMDVLSPQKQDYTYLIDLGISHQLFHRVLCVEPIASKNLHGVSRYLIGNISSKGLCNGGVVRVPVARVNLPSCSLVREPCEFNFHRHFCKQKWNSLVLDWREKTVKGDLLDLFVIFFLKRFYFLFCIDFEFADKLQLASPSSKTFADGDCFLFPRCSDPNNTQKLY